jgi:hypothetical protein
MGTGWRGRDDGLSFTEVKIRTEIQDTVRGVRK